jgi:hypothetical protein
MGSEMSGSEDGFDEEEDSGESEDIAELPS